MLDDDIVVAALEGMLGQHEDLGWTEAQAQQVVEEEVVELVGTYEVFGLLGDVALGVGGCELGRQCIDEFQSDVLVGFRAEQQFEAVVGIGIDVSFFI